MIVRITEGLVAPGMEAEFSAVARQRKRTLGLAPGMIHLHLGRRVTPSGTEFVFVTVWRSVDDLRAATGDTDATSRMAREHPELFARIDARHFEQYDDDTPDDG